MNGRHLLPIVIVITLVIISTRGFDWILYRRPKLPDDLSQQCPLTLLPNMDGLHSEPTAICKYTKRALEANHKPFLHLLTVSKTYPVELAKELRSSESDMICISTKLRTTECDLHSEGANWEQARNLLWRSAVQKPTKYNYYIFVDEDVVFIRGSLNEFHNALIKYIPAAAVPTLSKLHSPIAAYTDASLMALHAGVFFSGVHLPYQQYPGGHCTSQAVLFHLLRIYKGHLIVVDDCMIRKQNRCPIAQSTPHIGSLWDPKSWEICAGVGHKEILRSKHAYIMYSSLKRSLFNLSHSSWKQVANFINQEAGPNAITTSNNIQVDVPSKRLTSGGSCDKPFSSLSQDGKLTVNCPEQSQGWWSSYNDDISQLKKNPLSGEIVLNSNHKYIEVGCPTGAHTQYDYYVRLPTLDPPKDPSISNRLLIIEMEGLTWTTFSKRLPQSYATIQKTFPNYNSNLWKTLPSISSPFFEGYKGVSCQLQSGFAKSGYQTFWAGSQAWLPKCSPDWNIIIDINTLVHYESRSEPLKTFSGDGCWGSSKSVDYLIRSTIDFIEKYPKSGWFSLLHLPHTASTSDEIIDDIDHKLSQLIIQAIESGTTILAFSYIQFIRENEQGPALGFYLKPDQKSIPDIQPNTFFRDLHCWPYISIGKACPSLILGPPPVSWKGLKMSEVPLLNLVTEVMDVHRKRLKNCRRIFVVLVEKKGRNATVQLLNDARRGKAPPVEWKVALTPTGNVDYVVRSTELSPTCPDMPLSFLGVCLC